MKLRRFIAIILALVLTLPLFPGKADAVSGSDLCIQYTPQMVENTFRYLDEMYIEKYPQMGLRWLYGTESDRQVLAVLSDKITANCSTDRQKADAIFAWIKRNIQYISGGFFSIDAFYDREGNCMAQAQLMQDLLRLAQIPAVVGDGYIGNMEKLTVATMKNLAAGHAWCFAYVDGQWVMYDPVGQAEGLTDRDYLAKTYFMDAVEQITPVYESSSNAIPARGSVRFLYINGRFMCYLGDTVTNASNSGISVNRAFSYYVESNQGTGLTYVDKNLSTDGMLRGELYRGGWVTSSLNLSFYAYENGINASSTVMEHNGQRYWLHNATPWKLCPDEADCRFTWGMLNFPVGYSGQILLPLWYDWYLTGSWPPAYGDPSNMRIKWNSLYPDIATVDQNGKITALSEGTCTFELTLFRGDSEISYVTFEVDFSSQERIPDYTDKPAAHVCSYKLVNSAKATCTADGYEHYLCDCSKDHYATLPAYGHSYSAWETVSAATTSSAGLRKRTCMTCGAVETVEIPKLTGSTTPTEPSTEETSPIETTPSNTAPQPSPTDPTAPSETTHECVFSIQRLEEGMTCQDETKVTLICYICGNAKDGGVISGKNHTYGDWIILEEAGEDWSGLKMRICDICGFPEDALIPPENGTPVEGLGFVWLQGDTAQVPNEAVQLLLNTSTPGGNITIPLTQVDASLTTASLSSYAFQWATEYQVGIILEMPGATVALDTQALSAIASNGAETIQVSLHPVTVDNLSQGQATALGSLTPALILSIQLTGNEQDIHDFSGGKATVTIPFSAEDGFAPEDYRVVYLAEDGSFTDMAAQYINGYMTFVTDHFSAYAIVRGSTETTPNETTPNESDPITDDDAENAPSLTWLWIGLGVLAVGGGSAAAYFLILKKKSER